MSGSFVIHEGDVLSMMREMPDNSADALLSDPPYGILFMGKRWDISVPGANVWSEALRVLKPGAPMLVFGGTRTFHRLACAIEDGGAEIRDCISWLYFSGFPKSLAIDKAIDAMNGDDRPVVGEKRSPDGKLQSARVPSSNGKYADGAHNSLSGKTRHNTSLTSAASAASAPWTGMGTAMKPGWEPCLIARKPIEGTVAENALKWGVGGLNIDGCRIEYADEEDRAAAAAAAAAQRLVHQNHGNGIGEYGLHGANAAASLQPYLDKQALGRWPSTVCLDENAATALDEQAGDRPGMSGGGVHRDGYRGRTGNRGQRMNIGVDSATTARGDRGGASRFLYVAKPTQSERDLGCSGNAHPTVKPISLARWLARLALPPARESMPRTILVPFSGSGSEIVGSLLAGWDRVIAIEREPEYIAIARARCELAITNPRAFEALRDGELNRGEKVDERQASLFGRDG